MMLNEDILFSPSDAFKTQSNVKAIDEFALADSDREAFWGKQAESLSWFEPWHTVLQWNPPDAQWFIGGKLNASYNCLDRHLKSAVRYKPALICEGEKGESRIITYETLFHEVSRFSNVLKSCGISKGDRVAIYMPLVPEAVVAMLSCARIGAIHTVIFAGFSSDALKERINDAEAKLLITADGGFRRGQTIPLKEMADQALIGCPSIEKVIVLRHAHRTIPMQTPRDCWYEEMMNLASSECPATPMDAEDPLFILYTSGTTGKPKGILHTTGGYMVGVTKSMQWVFDIKPTDIYWCTADVGWITGHSYVVYGPLANGMTQVIYEGAFDYPQHNRCWKLIEKYKVTILYTAPTAIRTFMKWGEQWLQDCDLSSLRLLGSVGEPINPEAWLWYHTHVGRNHCPIVDTWWQTETGSIVIAPLPGVTSLKPGSATTPLPGYECAIIDNEGKPSEMGSLVITSPWPSMLRGIYKNSKRYYNTYWSQGQGFFYFTGDGAKQDDEGYFWLMGRIDDAINVSGHLLGTMEIESALVDHKSVAEAAVIGAHHDLKGQAIVAFVCLKDLITHSDALMKELKEHVVLKIGALARPERILFIPELPKTRSGKIMRRLLKDIAEGRIVGDTTTLSDPETIATIKKKHEREEG